MTNITVTATPTLRAVADLTPGSTFLWKGKHYLRPWWGARVEAIELGGTFQPLRFEPGDMVLPTECSITITVPPCP